MVVLPPACHARHGDGDVFSAAEYLFDPICSQGSGQSGYVAHERCSAGDYIFAIAGLTTIIANRTVHYVAQGMKSMPDGMNRAFQDTYLILAGVAVVGLVLGTTLRKLKTEKSGARNIAQDEGAMLDK